MNNSTVPQNTQVSFDATTVAPSTANEPVPAGWYLAEIDESGLHPSKKNPAVNYLKMRFKVAQGDFAGKVIYEIFNLYHPDEQPRAIAQSDLSAICHATGIMQIADTTILHGKVMAIKVKVTPKTDQYEPKNEITGYKKQAEMPEASPTKAPAPAVPAAAPGIAPTVPPGFAAPGQTAAPVMPAPAAAPASVVPAPAPGVAPPAPLPGAPAAAAVPAQPAIPAPVAPAPAVPAATGVAPPAALPANTAAAAPGTVTPAVPVTEAAASAAGPWNPAGGAPATGVAPPAPLPPAQ